MLYLPRSLFMMDTGSDQVTYFYSCLSPMLLIKVFPMFKRVNYLLALGFDEFRLMKQCKRELCCGLLTYKI